MTYTEKVLEAYCKKFGLCKEKGTCQCKKELKFIAESIAQAIAEERERIEQEITKVCKYAEDYRNYDMRGVDWQSILHPSDLLSSLDKPLIDKKDI